MSRSVILNIVGLTPRLISEAQTPHIFSWMKRKQGSVIQPQIPAVTCTMQATFLTGRRPTEHGIVANGWYDRDLAEVHMWKQSNHLVRGAKLWDKIRQEHPGYTVAKTFWWYNMYSTADYSITPRPMYPADGRKVFDVYTQPAGMREEIKVDLGDFPFPAFWGPVAGLESSQWIADAARWIEEKHWPNLQLVYLSHLDYNLQRLGPNDPAISQDLREIDAIVGKLLQFFKARAVKVFLLSEYGITAVDHPVHLNRIFREKGWIAIREELGLELLDFGASKVFAVADHQVAHVYLNDYGIAKQVRDVLEATPGVQSVVDPVWKSSLGIDHARAGDFVVVADPRSWFTYYYWLDDTRAPDFARCVDIHRKPGYDPVELFFDPAIKNPKIALASKLAKKKLGMRVLMDVIPLDPTLVKGSHGRIPEDQQDWPILAGDFPELVNAEKISAMDVHHHLLRALKKGLA
ncbi:MAG: alkaline phosphatase family protein [Verrucomicrobiales bacterium]|nr:alkaline phosphatase family protein [Verrucomicrobiales bacterium]